MTVTVGLLTGEGKSLYIDVVFVEIKEQENILLRSTPDELLAGSDITGELQARP